jgi:hypothetical protein
MQAIGQHGRRDLAAVIAEFGHVPHRCAIGVVESGPTGALSSQACLSEPQPFDGVGQGADVRMGCAP